MDHFAQARLRHAAPPDQANIREPRIGFFGVIDERLDLELLGALARSKPEWSIVVIGPVVKIDPASLPRVPNLHYLGQKSYEELPAYLAGWQVAMMPFALNESTRFISPTKTLEYLAGGKRVVSTPIRDVVTPYGERGLVQVADSGSFVAAVERALRGGGPAPEEIEAFLAQTSWERTWKEMSALLAAGLAANEDKVA
jgi:UDP-galactopyranose mutase